MESSLQKCRRSYYYDVVDEQIFLKRHPIDDIMKKYQRVAAILLIDAVMLVIRAVKTMWLFGCTQWARMELVRRNIGNVFFRELV